MASFTTSRNDPPAAASNDAIRRKITQDLLVFAATGRLQCTIARSEPGRVDRVADAQAVGPHAR
jgi:hypothetical protein